MFVGPDEGRQVPWYRAGMAASGDFAHPVADLQPTLVLNEWTLFICVFPAHSLVPSHCSESTPPDGSSHVIRQSLVPSNSPQIQ